MEVLTKYPIVYLDIPLKVMHCCCLFQVYSVTVRQQLKCFRLKDLQCWTMEV